jgi:hypothetical protein
VVYTFVIYVSPLFDVLTRAISITFEMSRVLCASFLVVLRSSCHQRMAQHKYLSLINIASVTLTVALVKTLLSSSNRGTCDDMLFIYLYSIFIQITQTCFNFVSDSINYKYTHITFQYDISSAITNII